MGGFKDLFPKNELMDGWTDEQMNESATNNKISECNILLWDFWKTIETLINVNSLIPPVISMPVVGKLSTIFKIRNWIFS